MRRLILGLVLAALAFACVPAGSARADTVRVPSVQGRILFSHAVIGRRTRVTQLVVIGVPADSRVRLWFDCTNCPGGIYDVSEAPDATGTVDLLEQTGIRATTGESYSVSVTDARGRVHVATLTARTSHGPSLEKGCFAGATPIPCEVTCDTTRAYPPGDDCEGAGGTVSVPNGKVVREFVGVGSNTRIKRLKVSGIAADATVIVICRYGDNCPIGLRALRPISGTVDVGALFGRRAQSPGTQILVWLVRGRERGDVLRITMRKGRPPRREKLCMKATELTPTKCPSAS